ncbi:MAG: methyl-accepting chemotaxis protein [Verrucomicrobiota bacterium]
MPTTASSATISHISLRWKILSGGLLVLLLAVVVFMVALWFIRDEILTVGRENISRAVSEVANKIEMENVQSLTVAKTMALAQGNGMFGDREASVAYAKAVLEANPGLTGAYFGYEPDADGPGRDAEFLAASYSADSVRAIDATGRFLPYWYRDHQDNSLILLEPLVNMETSYYYQGTKNRFLSLPESSGISEEQKARNSALWTPEREDSVPTPNSEGGWHRYAGIITEPYIYQGKFIVEQTYPIVIDGEFKGIAGVDRSLASLEQFVWSIRPFKEARLVVLSRRGRIVVHPHDRDVPAPLMEDYGDITHYTKEVDKRTYKGDNIDDPEVAHHDFLQEVYGQADDRPDPVGIELDGTDYFYASYRLPNRAGGWTVLMWVPKAQLLRPYDNARIGVVILMGGGMLLLLLALMWLTNFITRRIQTAATAARRVADGDLTVEIQADEMDETGQLLTDIANMVDGLNSLVGQVKVSSIELISTATRITAASKQQESAVNDFNSSTNEATAAVRQISATSQELSNTMEDVTGVASETAGAASEGRDNLANMQKTMRKLADATHSISTQLGDIQAKSNNIGSVISTITQVADQTNLLSLNAAMEAEKAGEYGLGFAVVAREIRRLADQTAQATMDIENMVGEMQSSVRTGVSEMKSFTEEVALGAIDIQRVSDQFSRIIEQVETLKPRFESVAEGMHSQTQGAAQISSAMEQLTESARQSLATLNEFNAATGQLHHAVQGLKEEISHFKVD